MSGGAVDGGRKPPAFLLTAVVCGGMATFPPDVPADTLGARLGGCVDGTLQLSPSEVEGDSLEDDVMEPLAREPDLALG